jgi:alpha-beta hydrolase superfamily lysophospholipase
MKQRELYFPGCQDASLFGQAWLPEHSARGVIVISHGLAEHGGRYSGLAARLVDKGHAVYAIDHRGHGRSTGRRANIERFDYLVSDLGIFIGRAHREHPDTPVILLGHSMGGAVALACALKYHKVLRALVLSAPTLAAGEALPAFKVWMVKLLSAIAPDTGALTLPAAAESRDPVLVQHGTADSLVSLAAVYPIYQHLGIAKSRTLQVYEGLYHEVYNEPERDRVIGDLEAWLAR